MKYKIKKFQTKAGKTYWIASKNNFETIFIMFDELKDVLSCCKYIEAGSWQETIETPCHKDWYIPVIPFQSEESNEHLATLR